MYIVVLKDNNRVIKQGYTAFKGLSDNVVQIEVESIPKVNKGQYLTYKDGEFTVNEIKYTEIEKKQAYEKMVESLVRGKYSVADELAILRQRNTKIEEFNTYFTFVENAKQIAKSKIYG